MEPSRKHLAECASHAEQHRRRRPWTGESHKVPVKLLQIHGAMAPIGTLLLQWLHIPRLIPCVQGAPSITLVRGLAAN